MLSPIAITRRAKIDPDVPDLAKENIWLVAMYLQKFHDPERISQYFSAAIGYDDLFNEMLLVLVRAANAFDEKLGYTFGAFARACMRKRLSTLINADRRETFHMYLDEGISHEDAGLINAIEAAESVTVVKEFSMLLSPRERVVLTMMMDGMSQKDVAAVLGVGTTTVFRDVVAIRETYMKFTGGK